MTAAWLIWTARRKGFARRLIPACISGLALCLAAISGFAQSSPRHGTTNLTLAEFLGRVLERNQSVQQKLLEMAARYKQARGEYGAFEPELFAGAQHDVNNRENTVEQTRSTLSNFFEEENNVYQGGLESLVPTGARVRLGYSLYDLKNNLQTQENFLFRGATNGEFQTFFGLTVSQPLLKNFGAAATMAGIRLAALTSEQAFQEYRRQLMITMATAQASYWNLYLSQEQEVFFQESVATAEKILADNQARLQAGRGSQLEVLEAEAGVALRRSKLGDAEQRLQDTAGRLLSLSGDTVLATLRMIRAVDWPQVRDFKPSFYESWQSSYDHNPDYLIQRQKVLQESIRLGYARNQRLPDLNLKGSYGFNGLGETPSDSWADISDGTYPSWSIGVELRIPVGGGIKSANELAAARLRQRAAIVGLGEVETQIANSLNTAISKIASSRQSVQSYRTVVEFNQNLLDSAMARLEVGRIESRKVLDIESDLFDAKNLLVEASVQYERAFLELALLEGSVLRARNLDLTWRELVAQTDALTRSGELDDRQYADFVSAMRMELERKQTLGQIKDTPGQARARTNLQQITQPVEPWLWTNTVPAPFDSEQEKALRDALHQRLEDLNRSSGSPAKP